MPYDRSRLQFQDRDFEILRAIAESPACSRGNLAAAFFKGSYEAAKKRVQQLASAGLVRNDSDAGLGRSIISLTKKGLEILAVSEKTPRNVRTHAVSPKMRAHERMLADCHFALTAAARTNGNLSADIWHDPGSATFTVRCTDHATIETVRPDGFCSVQMNHHRKFFFFVEVDRSTETQGHLIHLAQQYRQYSRAADFAARFGDCYEAKRTTFRVLLILKSPLRLENTLKSLRLHAGVLTLFWLTTFDSFIRDPFGAIWKCPLDSDGAGRVECRTLFSANDAI
jgi:hypothetical protein